MRIAAAVLLVLSFALRVEACSCAGPGTPCSAAGMSAAVFTGTVVDISLVPAQFPPGPPNALGRVLDRGAPPDASRIKPGFRLVRLQVKEVFTGVAAWQKEIEIDTGMGGGDCGFPFQRGMDYFIYGYKNAEGRLTTSICSRTRPVAEAAEDLRYFRALGDVSTSEIRVRTGFPGVPGKQGITIVAEGEGLRNRAVTDAGGYAVFKPLPPGEYRIHIENDGDLPDDPKVQLYSKGCREVFLIRTLQITGRITTKDGRPAARVDVHLRTTSQTEAESSSTNSDGQFNLRITRPGQYYLGINLNHTATRETPYPRWFFPGTEDQALAGIIEFSGKQETRTYNLSLPERQSERVIEGIVSTVDGHPKTRARVAIYDSFDQVIDSGAADSEGRFRLRGFADVGYRIHAVWPGDRADPAVSAIPTDISPGTDPLSLRLVLTEPGNSLIKSGRRGPGGK